LVIKYVKFYQCLINGSYTVISNLFLVLALTVNLPRINVNRGNIDITMRIPGGDRNQNAFVEQSQH